MNTRVIAAIAAAVLALVGIGAVVFYASDAQSRAYQGATLVTVYRASTNINANATAEEVQGLVTQLRLPNAAVPKGAIRDLSEIAGLKTTVPLVEGETLVKARFDKGGSSAASGSAVPKGLQEVTVLLGGPSAGNISAGQRVGIIATGDSDSGPAARMFAQSVLVTGVETSDGGKQITFAANGKLATEIAAAAQFGQIRLTLQNDESTKDGGDSIQMQKIVK